MTAEDARHRGLECQEAGDLAGAERAYREADELGDADSTILLGLVLKRRGDLSSAADAFRRAEARGHREAASSFGNLLREGGDLEGAKAAYERSVAAGSVSAALNLGLLLAQEGAGDEALPYLRAAEENGFPEGSWAVGNVLQGRGDFDGAEAAYRRAAEAGNASGAYGLGMVLLRKGNFGGARAALQQAHDLGHEGAGEVLQEIVWPDDADAVAGSASKNAGADDTAARVAMEAAAKWAQVYVAICKVVLDDANDCIAVANEAVNARNAAAQRPQHEISIETFTRLAKEKEEDFIPLYRAFAKACATARETAANFLAAQTVHDPEVVLRRSVGEDVLKDVALVQAILRVDYEFTPAGFLEGVRETNILMQNPFSEGEIIYAPPPSLQSEDRACPWCAETIKAAAVICRFCGHNVRAGPSLSV